ncbi:MAG TPA: ceramidase domain-containing protein [Woeseiaceae bacterium]|jgi:hypothetical protein
MKRRALFLAAAVFITAAFAFDPVAQAPDYHQFADTRRFLGIANFWNVVTNLPFLYAGFAGLKYLSTNEPRGILPSLVPAYRAFFAGVLLTAIGSARYHIAPDNDSLLWDRLPMTLVFMSLFSIIVGEHISGTLGRRVLLPLLLVGVASAVYWSVTERLGIGDLRPYVLVQFMPMLLIPLVLLMYSSHFDRTAFLWGMIVVYTAAKLVEHFDYAVYAFGELLSGHSVKHLAAATASLLFLYGLRFRQPRQPFALGAGHAH